MIETHQAIPKTYTFALNVQNETKKKYLFEQIEIKYSNAINDNGDNDKQKQYKTRAKNIREKEINSMKKKKKKLESSFH